LRDQKKERRIKKYSNSEREGSLFQKLRESEAQGPWPISQKSHSIVLKQNKTKQNKSRWRLLVAVGSGPSSNNNKAMTGKSWADKKTQQPRIKDAPNNLPALPMSPQNAGRIPDQQEINHINC
jgi:hypothetical protein